MENSNNQPSQGQQQTSPVQFRDLLYRCLSKWYWFVLSVAICLAAAVFYVLRTPSVYTRSADIMIKNNNRGRSIAGDGEQFAELGLFNTNTNVYNELKAISAKANMLEVVKRLNLDMNYIVDGRFHDITLYGHSLPVSAEILDISDNRSCSFDMSVTGDGKVTLSSFVDGEVVSPRGLTVTGVFADTLSTPVGYVVVNPTTSFAGDEEYPIIHVNRAPMRATALRYASHLSATLSDKMSQVIHLSFTDISTQRAEDILNTLVLVYNENWIADKNQIAVSTSMFINERLDVIEQELASVDNDISSYKSENLLPDVKAASSMYMSQSSAINSQITDLNNDLYMTRYIRTYITAEANKNQLLPVNSGISSSNIENQIRDYNEKVLQRNDLLATSSESNPLVAETDRAIESLRQAIITSVDNQILALNNQISSLQRNERQATARIAANPTQARYLLSVERQQSVKEALYLFLLQKREENELSQAFTAYNTRLIDPPAGSQSPSAPRKKLIYLMAILIGLCIPLAWLYFQETLNTKVRGKSDVKDCILPFAGEIPFAASKQKSKQKSKKDSKTAPHESMDIVVRQGSRNTINEAFRVLRTNVEFMSTASDSNVIAVTSFNPASGKSFISANLACALAVKGKRVLVIDCDLRHASLSTLVGSPSRGIVNYLGGQTDDFASLIVSSDKAPGLSIFPVGVIPPNPSELVADARFDALIDALRKDFEYIILDCPPVDIVADTQIIDRCVDRTLFIIRAGVCERSMLSDLDTMYSEDKYRNLALVLNGTELSGSGYLGKYGYKYGYRYGYRYGYQYGHYGHGYTSDEDDAPMKSKA